jgi:hypothetical protein
MTKCAGQPASHHRASALQKVTKNVGGVANASEDNTGFNRVAREKSLQIVERRAEQELDLVVGSAVSFQVNYV